MLIFCWESARNSRRSLAVIYETLFPAGGTLDWIKLYSCFCRCVHLRNNTRLRVWSRPARHYLAFVVPRQTLCKVNSKPSLNISLCGRVWVRLQLQFDITMQTKWRKWAALGSCWRMMLEEALNCVCYSPTTVAFVELTIRSYCDKCMTPTWIMDHPEGQTLGQKAVRPRGPVCVTSLTPYKFTSSQNW